VRVVVADDSVLLREGLVRLLTEVDCQVVAAVEDAPSFLRAVSEQRPDVAIVDVRMPPGMTDDGLRAAVEARKSQPDMGILMLSAYVELSYADVLLSDGRGGVGYLLKDRVTSLWTPWLTPCERSPPAARCSTPRSSHSSWWRGAEPIRSAPSALGSGRCWL
jgi:CheY-like chemotaxis protein